MISPPRGGPKFEFAERELLYLLREPVDEKSLTIKILSSIIVERAAVTEWRTLERRRIE